ncbi:MAG: hypothetical protein MJE77_00555 [Proteobacteria bacterium]|nr:hypothetical protein [Pseudomonadota bacterium]
MANQDTPDPSAKQRVSFWRGVLRGVDPAAATAKGGISPTTLSSPWLHRRCARCKHSFRQGDRVVHPQPGKPPVHTDDTAFCACPDGPTLEQCRDAEAFYRGLKRGWNPGQATHVTTLPPGHPALAPPRAGFGRKTCAVCGHTLRPHDEVVLCPCRPEAPLCQAAVHCDIVHQLPCLNDWNDRAGQPACPVTSIVRRQRQDRS